MPQFCREKATIFGYFIPYRIGHDELVRFA